MSYDVRRLKERESVVEELWHQIHDVQGALLNLRNKFDRRPASHKSHEVDHLKIDLDQLTIGMSQLKNQVYDLQNQVGALREGQQEHRDRSRSPRGRFRASREDQYTLGQLQNEVVTLKERRESSAPPPSPPSGLIPTS